MKNKVFTIKNELGLHARASAKLIDLAKKYVCTLKVSKDEKQTDLKKGDILEIMLLEAIKGTKITVVATGKDEKAAIEAIKKLIDSKFDEDIS